MHCVLVYCIVLYYFMCCRILFTFVCTSVCSSGKQILMVLTWLKCGEKFVKGIMFLVVLICRNRQRPSNLSLSRYMASNKQWKPFRSLLTMYKNLKKTNSCINECDTYINHCSWNKRDLKMQTDVYPKYFGVKNAVTQLTCPVEDDKVRKTGRGHRYSFALKVLRFLTWNNRPRRFTKVEA